MNMTCEVSRHGTTANLIIKGNVYENEATILKQNFLTLPLNQVKEVIIDMGGVEFFGSSAVGKLLLLYKSVAEHKGTMRLVRTPDLIAKLFNELRIDTLFEVSRA